MAILDASGRFRPHDSDDPDGDGCRDGAIAGEQHPVLVSIVINNYNYARFLRDAIDSALNQLHPNTEVVVVDDGSNDQSLEIIASYGDRVIPVLKENGGQISAFNAGFAVCRGEIVIFLDSDDMLLPHTASMVVEAFRDDPGVAKIQYRLENVNVDGEPMGTFNPPANFPMLSGDLRAHMLRFPDDVRVPPTSGNAFPTSILRRIMPIPESPRYGPSGADLYLHNLAPLFGPVKSLAGVGARYRIHGANHFYQADVSPSQARRIIVRTCINRDYLVEQAQLLGLPNVPGKGSDILSVTLLANRMVSLKMEPHLHPIAGDSLIRLAYLGSRASARRFDLPVRTRMVFMLWFIAAACSPRSLARTLLAMPFYAERRGFFGRFISAR